MGMKRPERIQHNLHRAQGYLIGSIEMALKYSWGEIDQIAAELGLPTMTVDEVMRSYHIGPYDRRKEPR